MSQGIGTIFVEEGKEEILQDPDWPANIKIFIKLIQLLPQLPGGQNVVNDTIETIDKFLIYSDVSSKLILYIYIRLTFLFTERAKWRRKFDYYHSTSYNSCRG